MLVFLYSDVFVVLAKACIVTCVADVLPTCTVAGSPDQKQKYNFEQRYLLLSLWRYCYYIMISVHRQLIIVDTFTLHRIVAFIQVHQILAC